MKTKTEVYQELNKIHYEIKALKAELEYKRSQHDVITITRKIAELEAVRTALQWVVKG